MSERFLTSAWPEEQRKRKIRSAESSDLPVIMNIYAQAKELMAAAGNPIQWGGAYPQAELLAEDIRQKRLYVMEKEDGIYGVFAFILGEDPAYQRIEGSWRDASAYGTIHRLAGKTGSSGVFKSCVAFCRQKCGHLRADTHRDNHAMRHLLEKYGFAYRGIIYVEDGTPRLAYESSHD